MDRDVDTDDVRGGYDESVFESVELWPVHLTFLTTSGLTLWGTARIQDGPDRVLTLDGRLVLLGSERELRTFIAQDEASSMAGLPGYELLRQHVRDSSVRLDEHTAFDYRAVANALDWPPDRWDLESFSALVDSLNMLADIAEALGDNELLARFATREYVAQLERLTFLTEDEVSEAAATVDRSTLRYIVGMGIDHIERRVAFR